MKAILALIFIIGLSQAISPHHAAINMNETAINVKFNASALSINTSALNLPSEPQITYNQWFIRLLSDFDGNVTCNQTRCWDANECRRIDES